MNAAIITGAVAIIVMIVSNIIQYSMLKKQLTSQCKLQAENLAFERDRQFKHDKMRVYVDFLMSALKISFESSSYHSKVATAKNSGKPAPQEPDLTKAFKANSEANSLISFLAPKEVVEVKDEMHVKIEEIVFGQTASNTDGIDQQLNALCSKFIAASRKDLDIED